jgi:hypothetical protein
VPGVADYEEAVTRARILKQSMGGLEPSIGIGFLDAARQAT